MNDALENLTSVNLDDLVSSFGWQDHPAAARALRTVFRAPAAKFARRMLEFDRLVGELGLPEGARRTEMHFAHDVRVFGCENLPPGGPVLVLSNHPGITDTLSLFTAIGRADLRIIALDRPFLQSLTNVTRHLYYISEDSSARISAVKRAAAHLRQGGAVLTFPAGQIEPDADVYPGALEALDGWTDSAGVFVRFAPQTRIVPALVRGVIWDRTAFHPLTRIKRDREERERLAAALQLLAHMLFDVRPVTVKVQFGAPVTVEQVGSTELAAIHAAVIGRMRGMIEHPPQGEGISVL